MLAPPAGMKLYQRRATDYFERRCKGPALSPLQSTSKMKVTLQAEEVINLLWDVIAAKGFEKTLLHGRQHIRVRQAEALCMSTFSLSASS
jgi:acyl-CoA dehydrogenase